MGTTIINIILSITINYLWQGQGRRVPGHRGDGEDVESPKAWDQQVSKDWRQEVTTFLFFSSSVFVFCLLLFSLQSHQFEMTGKHFHFYVSVFFLFTVFRMSHIFTFVYSSSMMDWIPTIFRSIHFNAFNNRIICATDFLILDEIFFHILSHCCLLNHLSSWWSLLNNFSYLWKFFTLSWQKQRRTAAASWRRPQVLFQNLTFSVFFYFSFWFSMLAKVLFQNFTFLFFLLQFFVFTSIKPELSLFWNKLCDISCSRDKYLHLSCVLLLFQFQGHLVLTPLSRRLHDVMHWHAHL